MSDDDDVCVHLRSCARQSSWTWDIKQQVRH